MSNVGKLPPSADMRSPETQLSRAWFSNEVETGIWFTAVPIRYMFRDLFLPFLTLKVEIQSPQTPAPSLPIGSVFPCGPTPC